MSPVLNRGMDHHVNNWSSTFLPSTWPSHSITNRIKVKQGLRSIGWTGNKTQLNSQQCWSTAFTELMVPLVVLPFWEQVTWIRAHSKFFLLLFLGHNFKNSLLLKVIHEKNSKYWECYSETSIWLVYLTSQLKIRLRTRRLSFCIRIHHLRSWGRCPTSQVTQQDKATAQVCIVDGWRAVMP